MAVAISNTANTSSSSSATTYNFAGQSIGTAAADRVVAVATGSENFTPARTISSSSIAGTSATTQVSATSTSGFSAIGAGIVSAAIPTGTSGTISVTWSGSVSGGCGIGVFSITGSSGAPPSSTASDTAVASDTFDASLTIPTNGGAIGYVCARSASSTPTWTWTNLTESFDATINNGDGLSHSGALSTSAGAATRSVVGSTSVSEGVLVLAAWDVPAASGQPTDKRHGGVPFMGTRGPGWGGARWAPALAPQMKKAA